MANVAITLTEDQQRKNDTVRQQLQQNREAQTRIVDELSGEPQGKPTPTQEENDMAKLGAYIPEHEPDGSLEQPAVGYPDPRAPGLIGGPAPQPQPSQGQATQQNRQPERQRGQFQPRQSQPNPNE